MADFLESAHTSSPLLNRLVVTYIENGLCVTEVWECFDMGDITYENQGDPQEVVCTNIRSKQNEVVATIPTGATNKVTFSLSRLLPADKLSKFMRLILRNCNLKMYLVRASECEDITDPQDFGVMEYFGVVDFGNYTRTAHLHMDKSAAAAVLEGTTVTAYEWKQLGHNNLTVRGDVSTDNFTNIALCDEKSCADPCFRDSDGCQKWFAIQNDGALWWTDDQGNTEQLLATIPAWTGVPTSICCVGTGSSAQLIISESTALGDGAIHTANRDAIIEGGAVTWTTYTVDTNANLLEQSQACHSTDENVTWFVGELGTIYQYDLVYGTITPVAGVANVVSQFTAIEMKGDTVVIGGLQATVIRSQDGGNSFLSVTVTDPLTGLPLDGGIDIVDVAIISKTNWMVATSDDRVLYTLNDGSDWQSQLIPGQGAGTINAIEFHQDLGYMARDEDGGLIWKTYYGNCQPWLPLPETEDLFPEVDSLLDVKICDQDPNVFMAVGSLDGATGVVIRGTGDYE